MVWNESIGKAPACSGQKPNPKRRKRTGNEPGLISEDEARLRALDLQALSLVSEDGCLGGLLELGL